MGGRDFGTGPVSHISLTYVEVVLRYT